MVFPALLRPSLAVAGRTLIALSLLAATASVAQAQIYSWRDESGSLVVSNVLPGTNLGVASYDVPEADGIRTTRYAAPDEARPYDTLIVQQAARHGVREDLVRAVIQVESAFNPRAVSPAGAMGLMQLMPSTARQFGVVNAFDPAQNVTAGVAYLRQLLDRYDNNERLALAAYNAGPSAVDRHGQTIPPIRETRRYVSKVTDIAGGTVRASVATRTAEASTAPDGPPPAHIYRVVEMIDGREIVKYTDRKPDNLR